MAFGFEVCYFRPYENDWLQETKYLRVLTRPESFNNYFGNRRSRGCRIIWDQPDEATGLNHQRRKEMIKRGNWFLVLAITTQVAIVWITFSRAASTQDPINLGGHWNLAVQMTVSYPAGLTCSFLNEMGDPDILVTQDGGVLHASETDTAGTPFTLEGTVNGNAVEFTISGFGISPGDGGCSNACAPGMTTKYSGKYDSSSRTITGTVQGYGNFSSERNQYGVFDCSLGTWTATWVGTFSVKLPRKVPIAAPTFPLLLTP
jgi:hypothetical protein